MYYINFQIKKSSRFLKSLILVLITLFVFAAHQNTSAQVNYAQYVNPFIGTGGHGHTFPGAVLPFGMVQLSPDTRIDGSWDGCSGYHYSDSVIYGFSHTHLSGTGVSDWGDILVMPTTGQPSADNKVYASKFNHKNEKAEAGFYEVLLDDENIKAELTTTLRVGIHRYTFPKRNDGNLILDLLHRDKTLLSNISIIDSVTISGYRMSEAWARSQQIYFVIKFSKPFKKMEFAINKMFKPKLNFKIKERAQGAYFKFDVTDNKPLIVKVAISSVSAEGAIKNLTTEAPHWNFEKYKNEAAKIWNTQLSKLEVKDPDKNKLITFYTALYHCFTHPSLNMDVDNQYRGRDGLVHKANGFINYSVFSLWDTYRALHPLFTILEWERTRDFINTFLIQYSQSGRLPMWELSGNETDCMIGFHSVSVIADAFVKGISNFDTALVYKAVSAAATYTNFGIPVFNKNALLQIDDESESVSKSLEYAYDNWCLAQLDKLFLKNNAYLNHIKLSQSYKSCFDSNTGFMRPRKNGNWLSPFYPNEINNHFTEGNSWQYSFYVPHDINGLINLHGGIQNFETKLDELFTTSQKTRGREQSDVTGLIGQYAHGNEPSHHMAYLYNFVGKPQKTIERVSMICRDFYKNSPDGLIGNEDCGQMSAWYVFSAIGMYPVCPGSQDYILGIPAFNNIKINLENGKSFTIKSDSKSDKVISGINLQGDITFNSFIKHNQIVSGGKMEFLFKPKTDTANSYGQGAFAPTSMISDKSLIPSPIINAPTQVFKGNMQISLNTVNGNDVKLFYTTDGSEPNINSKEYKVPFVIDTNAVIKAIAVKEKEQSAVTKAVFYKLKYNYDVAIVSVPNSQYSADGAQSLIDGIYADLDWRKGNWIGVQPQDFECLIDLKKQKEIDYISLNCLQDTRSWIVFPTTVLFYGSNDNKNFTLFDSVSNTINANDYNVQVKKFEKKLAKKESVKYIKIVAKNFGKLPQWHMGSGGDAFIFTDEIEIK